MFETTTEDELEAIASAPRQLYIGGEWRDGGEGGDDAGRGPGDGETLVEVADATADDAKAALERRARPRFAQCCATRPRASAADLLRRAYDVITERADELALLMTLEMGKPVAESKAEIAYAAELLPLVLPRRRCASTGASRSTRPAPAAC